MRKPKAMEVIHKRYMGLVSSTLTSAEVEEELIATVVRRGVQRPLATRWVKEYLDA